MDNKSRYIEFCRNNDDIPIFHSPWWLDIVSDNWNVVLSFDRNGNIVGAMPYSQENKYGISVITQPKLTPYLGPLLVYPENMTKKKTLYSYENKHLDELISKLPSNKIYQYIKFLPSLDNWYPFYFTGYEQSTRYTYILEDIKKHDEIWAGLTNTLRHQIKTAMDKVIISQENDIFSVFSLVQESYKRQGVNYTITDDMLKKMQKELYDRGQGQIFAARDHSGQLYSAALLIWDSKKCYLLGLGTDRKYVLSYSTKLLIWELIKYASQRLDIFDFEGSMLPGVESLFRSFGGTRTPYFEVKKYKNRFVKSLFAIANR